MTDLFDELEPPLVRIDRRALEIWQARELNYPPFVRRMIPDKLDKRPDGTWDIVRVQAAIELGLLKAGAGND